MAVLDREISTSGCLAPIHPSILRHTCAPAPAHRQGQQQSCSSCTYPSRKKLASQASRAGTCKARPPTLPDAARPAAPHIAHASPPRLGRAHHRPTLADAALCAGPVGKDADRRQRRSKHGPGPAGSTAGANRGARAYVLCVWEGGGAGSCGARPQLAMEVVAEDTKWLWHDMQPHVMANATGIKGHVMLPLVGTFWTGLLASRRASHIPSPLPSC